MTTPTKRSGFKAEKSILDETAAKQFVSELIATRPKDCEFDAGEVLDQNPELREYNSVVLNLAYEEFCRRVELGELVNQNEFVASFPGNEVELLEMLRVHRYLDDNDLLHRDAEKKWPELGESFLGFELIEELGRGTFSRVFLASEPSLGGRFVVAKICTLGRNEANILGKLQHPQVVRVYSIGHDELSGLSVIPMAYLSRTTLLDVILHGFKNSKTPKHGREILEIIAKTNGIDARLEPVGADKSSLQLLRKCTFTAAVASIAGQLAEALAYTHSRGYSHCDVKPSNVLLTADGRAMLFDFNLASDKKVDLDNIGGTIPYMAPEQLRAVANPQDHHSHRIDARADVFAFGITIYHLLTGQLPYGPIPQHTSKREIADELLSRQQAGPQPVRKINPDVAPSIARIIESCLQFDPANRPASGSDLVELIRCQKTQLKRLQSWMYSRRRFIRASAGLGLMLSGTYAIRLLTYNPVQLGHEAYQDERYEAAERYYSAAITADSDDAVRSFWRGRARFKLGKYAEAEGDFTVANSKLSKPDGRVTACAAYCIAMEARRRNDEENRLFRRVEDDKLYENARFRFRDSEKQGFKSVIVDHNVAACWYIEGNVRNAFGELRNIDKKFDDVPQLTYFMLATMDMLLKGKDSPNPAYIESALKRGPHSNHLLYYAASTYATLLVQKTNAGDPELIKKINSICEEGLNFGFSKIQFEQISLGIPTLIHDREFQRLMQLASGNHTDPTTEWLVDPLLGIDEPVLDIGQ